MIGSLHGTVDLFDGNSVLINVHGVGYRVHVPQSFRDKYQREETVSVYTYTHVREDVLELFGFETLEEMKLFEALIGVSGIGPKTAIGVFGIGTKSQIISAIQKADVDFFTGVPRLGKKNAQKIIIELKGKLGSLEELDLTGNKTLVDSDVLTALKGFGFSQKEAEEAIKAVGLQATDTSGKLRLALKYLGK
ncbi:MAG: Holliday junction branch migration protein RuvA [Patescibacteria group bacterium]|nr:Holliday junction branch migration protein RuvA [Patescibacteria group bacterium]MDE2589518.1 Holliday junction branch migration protein RuvA [Patescibacteria group bacterium]